MCSCVRFFNPTIEHRLRCLFNYPLRTSKLNPPLLNLEIEPVIPSKANEDPDARPIIFDEEAYRQRNIVERLIGWLKESRRIFSRFEKTAKNFAGMIKMAFIHRYLRLMYN